MTPDEDAIYREYIRRGLSAETTTIDELDNIFECCNIPAQRGRIAILGLIDKGDFYEVC